MEFGKLVEEEDAVVREAHLARRRVRAAAEEAGVGDRVVRRAEGALEDERLVGGERAGDAVDLRRLQRLVERHFREDGREAAREHRLARAGRPDHDHVVAAGDGHLHRALGAFLSAHVGEVAGVGAALPAEVGDVDAHGVDVLPAAQIFDGLAQRADGDDVDAVDDGRLLGVVDRDEHARDAELAHGEGDGEDAAAAADLAAQRELADQGDFGRGFAEVEPAGGDDGADGDGEVEGGSLLLDVGRGEVDGGAPGGRGEAGVRDGGPDAVLALADGGVGEADDHLVDLASAPRVHLDFNGHGVDAHHGS